MIKSKSTINNDFLLTQITTNQPLQTTKPTMTRCLLSVAVASSLLLVGCNDDDNEVTVSYDTTVETISAFTTAEIDNGFGLDNTATPDAKCDIKIEKVNYPTVGAAGERTNATAALMLPSGNSADCQGDRPILLYAHGTTTEKDYDFSQVAKPQNPAAAEATLIAANYAAQGYIVVAPNYAGYDDSELDYHPYLVAEQQATDMVDALEGARDIIERQQRVNDTNYTNIDDSGKLFVAGYSQGGHVAMATARLLEQQNEPVTAIAPSSGPYALAAFGDAIFAGNVNVGATRFAPLLAEGMQNKYSDIYNSPSDIFSAQYADTRLPSMKTFGELVSAGELPDNALFQSKPTGNPILDQLPNSSLPFAFLGFASDNYLIKTDFRAAYVGDALQNQDSLIAGTGALPAESPQNPLRKALKDNDLRGYIPKMPTLLCGGNQDPTVYYDINTGSMSAILQQAGAAPTANLNVTVLDVDTRGDRGDVTSIGRAMSNPWMTTTVIDDVQSRFATNLTAIQNQAGPTAVLANYHGGLVSAACTQATREFFNQEFKAS
ncbi:hypothetical protein AAJP47_10590 [Psychrobacter sp. B38]|uniref:alpha/beta hydrolase family protein n=1 Tax=Psychrobacter sp. B38 TaxID=3143538 RepID=UPI00320FD9A9